MIIKRTKSFTKYDDTDNLKRMKDSDILAENEKDVPSYSSSVLPKAAAGAAIGAVGLGAAGALAKGLSKKSAGNRLASAARGGKAGLALGAIGGALALGSLASKKREKEREDAQFYNKRLQYAKKQALRCEKVDWKQNMTQREGYSF